MPATVTWLLPVKNAMPFLRQTLDSIAIQTYRAHEIIAWDNGSTDGTVQELERWIPGKIPGIVIADRPLGLGASLAAMVRMARCDLCARIDGDDLNLPDRLERQVEFMQTHPQVQALGSGVELIDEQDAACGASPPVSMGDAEIRWKLRFCNAFNHPTVMFRRDAVLEAGNYADVMPIEDYDLWVRMAARGRIANLAKPVLRYRVRRSSVSGQNRHRIDLIRRRVISQYAGQLFPGLRVNELERLLGLLDQPEAINVSFKDCMGFFAVAGRAGAAASGNASYFRDTELFKTQWKNLLIRWSKGQPGVGRVWNACRRLLLGPLKQRGAA